MMRSRSILPALLATAAFAAGIAAHPLGNFSVNQYSRLEISRSVINIRQVLDMAEIPTFQESAAIDTNNDGLFAKDELDEYARRITAGYISNLRLAVNGSAAVLKPASTEITLGTGSGGLPTIHIVWSLAAEITADKETNQASFRNANFAERVGWNEIVVQNQPGISVFNSTAFDSGLTDELKAYPQEFLSAPLAERSAEFSYSTGNVPAGAKLLSDRDGRPSTTVQKDRLAELITVPAITPAVAMIGLLIAFGLGAIHAMSPGHGKTIVGAYLVGSRGTVKHAVFLGLTVTITHTLGVFALGLITLFASSYILPERLMPFLSFVSGLLVFYIGITLFKNRLFSAFGWHAVSHGSEHEHTHGDDGQTHSPNGRTHSHGGNTHTHLPPAQITWRNLLALGISGGLLPCPSALVLMLSSISLGRVGYGLILTLVFSLGLAATLTCVGLFFLYIGRVFGGSIGKNRLVKLLPVFSALVVACVGAAICYSSLG